jgi:hypothetical protein
MMGDAIRRERALSVLLSIAIVLSVVAIGSAAFAGSAAAAASTVTVDDSGDYSSVQAAVNNEGSDTIIKVTDDTYDETVTFDNGESNVTIKANDSANPPEITGGVSIKSSVSDLTIEDVELSGDAGSSRTFQIGGGNIEDVTLSDVTFEGDNTQNTAIYGNSFAGNVSLTDISVANYTGDDWGVVYVSTSSGLEDVELTGSTVQNSTGMVEFHGYEEASGENITSVTVENTSFEGISEDSGEGANAALSVQDAEVRV